MWSSVRRGWCVSLFLCTWSPETHLEFPPSGAPPSTSKAGHRTWSGRRMLNCPQMLWVSFLQPPPSIFFHCFPGFNLPGQVPGDVQLVRLMDLVFTHEIRKRKKSDSTVAPFYRMHWLLWSNTSPQKDAAEIKTFLLLCTAFDSYSIWILIKPKALLIVYGTLRRLHTSWHPECKNLACVYACVCVCLYIYTCIWVHVSVCWKREGQKLTTTSGSK